MRVFLLYSSLFFCLSGFGMHNLNELKRIITQRNPIDSLSLFEAIESNDITFLRNVVDKEDFLTYHPNGYLPLTYASYLGKQEIVKLFLTQKVRVDEIDLNKKTALYYAVEKENYNIVNDLLEAKADPNKCSCLEIAIRSNNQEIIKLLAAYKADLNAGLILAAKQNNSQVFKELLNMGAKVNSNDVFTYSLQHRNEELMELALQNGADENQAIAKSVEMKHKPGVVLCLDAGANSAQAVQYVIAENDLELANELVAKYKLKANELLELALPGATTNPKEVKGVHLSIANVALMHGAKADPYFKYAVQIENRELIDLLLSYNGDPNELLAAAVELGNVNYAVYAFDKGAAAEKNNNLFLKALVANDSEMVHLFLDKDAPVTDARLIQAAVDNGNIDLTKRLLGAGAPVFSNSLVLTAVQNKHDSILFELLNFGANPNIGLVRAIDMNALSMVNIMLDAGAEGRTPSLIEKAAGNGSLGIAQALINKGAQPDDGVVASIRNGHDAMFNLLMESGADFNNIQFVVETVFNNQTEMFLKLMEEEAPVNYKTKNQENLLHISSVNGNYEITAKLLDRGVDPNQKNVDGETPLHISANRGRNNLEMCSLLINNGGKINAVDNKGRTVLKVADGKKLKDYLKAKGAIK